MVLYASSQVDKRKVGRLAMAIQVAFQELGVFDTSNTHIPLSDMEAIPFANVQAVQNVERTSDMERIVQPMKGILAPTSAAAPLKDIQAELEKALAPEIKRHVVDIKPRKEGLVVSLREMGFYESGASTMRASSVGAVDRLAQVIVPRAENLRIEGHTDNIPIHNGHFPSNWELSTARATELVRLFIVRYQVEPNRLSAAGCGISSGGRQRHPGRARTESPHRHCDSEPRAAGKIALCNASRSAGALATVSGPARNCRRTRGFAQPGAAVINLLHFRKR